MSELTSARAFASGTYTVTATMTSGTAKIQMTTDDHAAQDIDDASWAVAAIKELRIPKCSLTAVVTGDAQIFINKVKVNF